MLGVSDVALIGAGAYERIFNCNSSEVVPLQIYATYTLIEGTTLNNSRLSTNGTGIIFTTDSQLTIKNCIFSSGVVQNPPSSYSWRSSGGALQLAITQSPVTILLLGVQFTNNVVRCNEHACLGGAVAVQNQNTVNGSKGHFNIINCAFESNQVVAYGSANGVQGSAVSISNSGSAPLTVDVVNSTFFNNSMSNEENASVESIRGVLQAITSITDNRVLSE